MAGLNSVRKRGFHFFLLCYNGVLDFLKNNDLDALLVILSEAEEAI